jgi:hypothetical protein
MSGGHVDPNFGLKQDSLNCGQGIGKQSSTDSLFVAFAWLAQMMGN